MSVEENMHFALGAGGVLKADCRRRIDAVARAHHDLGATMIHFTHDPVEAMTLADAATFPAST